jgi:hypothetical protein
MKEMFFNSLGILGYVAIPILAGITTSFLAEFIFQITEDVVRRRYSLFFANLFVVLVLTKIFDNYYTGWLEFGFGLCINLLFAWLFHKIAGKTFTTDLIKKLKDLINRKVDGI